MAVRLRPQSAAWMAPHALAAQLNAQTGQIAGQGVASLLGGISQGIGAFTQARDQRRADAVNESRYQDSLRLRQADDARQDKSFQYGVIRDQVALNKDFKTGAELEYALNPTPENLMKVQQADSNNQALSAALAKYGGIQMPEMPQAPQGMPASNVPQMPAAPQTPDMQERLKKIGGFEALSDQELEAVTAGLASDLETMDSETDAVLKVDKVKGAARMAANRTERGRLAFDLALATSVLKRREAKTKVTQTEDEAAARARGTESVKGPADIAKTQATVAALQADLEKRGIKETLPLDEAEARKVYNDRVVEEPKRKEKAAKYKADAAARDERFRAVMALRTRAVAVTEARAAKSGSKSEDDKELEYLTKMFNLHNKQANAASDRKDFDASAAESARADVVLQDIEERIKRKLSESPEPAVEAPSPDAAAQKMAAWEAKNPGASKELRAQMWQRFKAGKE